MRKSNQESQQASSAVGPCQQWLNSMEVQVRNSRELADYAENNCDEVSGLSDLVDEFIERARTMEHGKKTNR